MGSCQLVELVFQRDASRFAGGGQFGHDQGRADAVLVPDTVTNAISKCLFVADGVVVVRPLHDWPCDPLKPGQGPDAVRTVRFGQPVDEAGRNDRRGNHHRACCPTRVLQDIVDQEGTNLVSAETTPGACVVFYANRQPVGVRIVGQDQIGVRIGCGCGDRQVKGSRFFRIGERCGGKVRVRRELFCHYRRCWKSSGLETGQEVIPANPVHSGVEHVDVSCIAKQRLDCHLLMAGDGRIGDVPGHGGGFGFC